MSAPHFADLPAFLDSLSPSAFLHGLLFAGAKWMVKVKGRNNEGQWVLCESCSPSISTWLQALHCFPPKEQFGLRAEAPKVGLERGCVYEGRRAGCRNSWNCCLQTHQCTAFPGEQELCHCVCVCVSKVHRKFWKSCVHRPGRMGGFTHRSQAGLI